MVCLTLFTENQEWYTFLPQAEAVAEVQVWQAGMASHIDVSGLDMDGKAQRAIFELSWIKGMSISDVSRWKRPDPVPRRPGT